MFFILALSFIYLFTYPYTPVIFNLFPFGSIISFPFNVLLISFIACIKNKLILNFRYKEFNIVVLLLIFLISLSFISTNNLTALRDILLLISLLSISITFDIQSIYKLINRYGRILGIFLIGSIIIFALMKVGIFSYTNWNVSNLNLNENSPILIRYLNSDDFEWYYIFGLLVHPENIYERYQRLTLIFLEPTQLSLFLLPIYPIIINDKFIKNKIFYISLFLLSIILALAFTAYLSIFFSLTFLLVNRIIGENIKDINIKKIILYSYLIIGIILMLSTLFFFPELTNSILGIISKNLQEKYEFIFEFKGVFNESLSLSLFGVSGDESEDFIGTLGIIAAIFRYGYIGIFIITLSFFYTVRMSINFLVDDFIPSIIGNVLCMAIISSFLLSLKLTNILFIQPMIIIIYGICIREKYKAEFFI